MEQAAIGTTLATKLADAGARTWRRCVWSGNEANPKAKKWMKYAPPLKNIDEAEGLAVDDECGSMRETIALATPGRWVVVDDGFTGVPVKNSARGRPCPGYLAQWTSSRPDTKTSVFGANRHRTST